MDEASLEDDSDFHTVCTLLLEPAEQSSDLSYSEDSYSTSSADNDEDWLTDSDDDFDQDHDENVGLLG